MFCAPWFLGFLAWICVFLPDSLLLAEERPAPSVSDLVRGKALFLNHCSICHGKSGKGDGPLAQSIPSIPDLRLASTQNQSDQYLFDQITNGKPPMPAFGSLSAKDRWDLVDYVRVLGEEK